MPSTSDTAVAIYTPTADTEVMQRHTAALLHLCTTRGWRPTTTCRTPRDVADILATRTIRTVVAIAPTPDLVETVAAAGGVLEVARPGPAAASAPTELVSALGSMVRGGRLTPDEAAALLHAARPGRGDTASIHRRPSRPA